MGSTSEPFAGLGNVIQARSKEVLSFQAMEVVTAYTIGFSAWGFRPLQLEVVELWDFGIYGCRSNDDNTMAAHALAAA